jgi:SAM-dependent methyltransferase
MTDPERTSAHPLKANMDHIYDDADPRAYLRELGDLGYVIPDLAKPIFQSLTDVLRTSSGLPVTILDIGCSYGINAALVKHDISMATLRDHWTDDALAAATPGEIADSGRQLLDAVPATRDLTMIGLDPSDLAVAFAIETGLLDSAITVDLENEPLPPTAEQSLEPVDLVISTGCVGYVTERTFERLMPVVTRGRQPWLANFVLRMFPMDAIDAALSDWGYVTEKLEGQTFAQRQFASAREEADILGRLGALGIDPAGCESDGQLHAEFYLSRPAGEAAAQPIESLITA